MRERGRREGGGRGEGSLGRGLFFLFTLLWAEPTWGPQLMKFGYMISILLPVK